MGDAISTVDIAHVLGKILIALSNIWTPLAKWIKIKQQGKSVTGLWTLPIVKKKQQGMSVTSIREDGDNWEYGY